MSDLGLCSYLNCTAPAVVVANTLGLCRDHLDWGLSRVLAPAQLLRSILPGMPARPRVERYLADAAVLLRAAESWSRDLDVPFAESCAAVALQAEDLLQGAADRLDHARAAQQGRTS